MATFSVHRNRGRLTPLEFLICAQAKLAQAVEYSTLIVLTSCAQRPEHSEEHPLFTLIA